MTNLECVILVLSSHRDARRWSDEAVALDVLAQLGLDAAGDAVHAAPVVDPSLMSEEEVEAAEAAAKEATDKALAARAALDAQNAAAVAPAVGVAPAVPNEEAGSDYFAVSTGGIAASRNAQAAETATQAQQAAQASAQAAMQAQAEATGTAASAQGIASDDAADKAKAQADHA